MTRLIEGKELYEIKGRQSITDEWRVIGTRYTLDEAFDLFKRHDKTWRYLIMEKATFKN